MDMAAAPDPADLRAMSGRLWEELLETLRASSRLIYGDSVPGAPRDRAEGLRYLTRLFASGLVTCVEFADPDYPEFGRMIDPTMKWGLDCPDCLYLYATVRGDATYRIWGDRGSANHLDIQVNYGHFAYGDISKWGTISSMSGLELESNADGAFELILSADRRDGNWLALAPNAEFVLVRQYFNDWANECPADIYIERVGAAYPAPPLRSDQIAARFDRLRMWLERAGGLWETMSRQALEMPANTLNVFLPQDAGERAGMRGQAYGIGNFQLKPDEAAIVEFAVHACRHWNVALANWYWESLDYATRQTSLNGAQATIDGDGVFRGVIAHEDPGVPNWLDTAGHERGTITARFLLAEQAPTPGLRVVPLSDVRDHLAADTPTVNPVQRLSLLDERRRAVLRRHRR